jgi:hypothetical protein
MCEVLGDDRMHVRVEHMRDLLGVVLVQLVN